jgi:hypothetical protein
MQPARPHMHASPGWRRPFRPPSELAGQGSNLVSIGTITSTVQKQDPIAQFAAFNLSTASMAVPMGPLQEGITLEL